MGRAENLAAPLRTYQRWSRDLLSAALRGFPATYSACEVLRSAVASDVGGYLLDRAALRVRAPALGQCGVGSMVNANPCATAGSTSVLILAEAAAALVNPNPSLSGTSRQIRLSRPAPSGGVGSRPRGAQQLRL